MVPGARGTTCDATLRREGREAVLVQFGGAWSEAPPECRLATIDVTVERRDLVRVSISDLPPALGDEGLLRTVLLNLLSNALKFSSRREESAVAVGFSSRAFRVFERLHEGENFEGTGIGPSIVKRIVERHGGHVWAHGKPGPGATFRSCLPGPA